MKPFHNPRINANGYHFVKYHLVTDMVEGFCVVDEDSSDSIASVKRRVPAVQHIDKGVYC